MRGRLIHPFLAVFERYDHAATPVDPVWRSPLTVPGPTPAGSSARTDKPLTFPVQVSSLDEFERLRDRASGNDPITQMRLVAHFRDLERRMLVRADGTPDLVVGDRLVELRTMRGALELRVPEPPGAYVHEVRSRGWGLSMNPRRNLLFIILRGRDRSVR